MSDTENALRDLIASGQDARGEPVSKLGYFCAPFRPGDGPFSDKVIKMYPSSASDADIDRLVRAHEAYVALILNAGVELPQTDLYLIATEGRRLPVIVQQALPADSMMRDQMIHADAEGTLALMEAAGEVIATFWGAVAGHPDRVGFHPSIRNLAVIDGQGIFFDTFPPLIGYSRAEMGQLLITYSGSRLMRSIGPLLKARVTGIQDEWYSPAETLVGLVGSACRLRPDDAALYLDWGRDFAGRRMPQHAAEIRAGLDAPPRLPGYWTTFRKLLGLQGEPNI